MLGHYDTTTSPTALACCLDGAAAAQSGASFLGGAGILNSTQPQCPGYRPLAVRVLEVVAEDLRLTTPVGCCDACPRRGGRRHRLRAPARLFDLALW